MQVVICGPNLYDQSKGTFHVHAAGCADLKRKVSREPMYAYGIPMDAASKVNVSTEMYADMTEEGDDPQDWVSDFYFFPCTEGLPLS